MTTQPRESRCALRWPVLIAFLASWTLSTSAQSLTTLFNGPIGLHGNMFDVRALNDITIVGLDGNLWTGGDPYTVEIYTKAGSYAGSENTAGDWTLRGTANAVASNGDDVPTALPIALSIPLQSGQTVAFYITCTTDGLNYTTGTAEGALFVSDANLEIYEGVGLPYPFGAVARPRVWNGTMYYQLGVNLPVELVSFDARVDGRRVLLTWETASETNNAGFEVEQFEARTQTWERMGFVAGAGTTTAPQTYTYLVDQPASGTHRFRLRQVDFDGTFALSPEVEIVVELPEAYVFGSVYPNPFNTQAHVTFAAAATQRVQMDLYNTAGQHVQAIYEGMPTAHETQTVRIDATGLPSGAYLLRLVGETFQATQRVMLIK